MPASGAVRYEVQASTLPEAPHLVPWDTAGTRLGGVYTHTFNSLGTGQVFTLAVRAIDNQSTTGTAAKVKCSTTPRNILTLECTTNALLVAKFSDPYAGTGLTPTSYKVQTGKTSDTQTSVRNTRNNIEVYPAEFGQQYQVTVTASHKTGWATYTDTDTITCPTHTDNWNSPNFFDPDEDCPSNIVSRAMCTKGYTDRLRSETWRLRGPRFSPQSAERVLLSRSCTTPSTTSRTCTETWAENITLLKDPDTVCQALGRTEWKTWDDWGRNLSTIISVASLHYAVLSKATVTAWILVVGAGTGEHIDPHRLLY